MDYGLEGTGRRSDRPTAPASTACSADDTFERFPGFREMLTGVVPMGRMGSPAEVAAAIAWLCSDAASFITGEG